MYVDQICKSYVLKIMCKSYVPDMWLSYIMISYIHTSGADPGFQVRGGALKTNCAERREALKLLGYFVDPPLYM